MKSSGKLRTTSKMTDGDQLRQRELFARSV
jgi:hypothetical protein